MDCNVKPYSVSHFKKFTSVRTIDVILQFTTTDAQGKMQFVK